MVRYPFGRRIISLKPCLFLVVLSAATLAQNNPPEPKPNSAQLTLKSQSVTVVVPAVITDSTGKHVANLKKEDFKVLENGKPQPITSLEEITTLPAAVAAPAASPNSFSNLSAAQHPLSPPIIVALDTINTPLLAQTNGRRQLLKALAKMVDDNHRLGLIIIHRRGIQIVGGIDSDPAAIIAALSKTSSEMSSTETFSADQLADAASDNSPSELTGGISPGEDPERVLLKFIRNSGALEGRQQGTVAAEDTLRAFLSLAWSLSGVPGRKSVLWVTGGIPFLLDASAAEPVGNLAPLYERAMKALNDAQVSVYPVDARGLSTNAANAEGAYGGAQSSDVEESTATRIEVQQNAVHNLNQFADATGGRAYTNTNDLAKAFRQAVEDSASYYLLSYALDPKDRAPGWRKLRVEVDRKGVEVRARNGFFVNAAALDPQQTRQADLQFALSSPVDSTAILISGEWKAPSPAGDKKRIAFTLHIPANSAIDEADDNRFDVEFLAQATDKNGQPVAHAGQSLKGAIPPLQLLKIKQEGIYYNNALALPPGTYTVHFVVRNNLNGALGSVATSLSVP